MSEKSIVQEARDIQLAMELINLGARLQMLESETQLTAVASSGCTKSYAAARRLKGCCHFRQTGL